LEIPRWAQIKIAWYNLIGQKGKAQSILSMEAGKIIERDILILAQMDPLTANVVDTRLVRPGPDLRRSPGSDIHYEITSAGSIQAHAERAGINGSNIRTRIVTYAPVRLDQVMGP
jgi:hypothetical protein